MEITRRSFLTGKIHTLNIPVTREQMKEFNDPNRTRLIQDIFPDLAPELRDFIKLGIHPNEWVIIGEDE